MTSINVYTLITIEIRIRSGRWQKKRKKTFLRHAECFILLQVLILSDRSNISYK